MSIVDAIQNKLREAFCPTHLALWDDSHKHAGHAAAKNHGGGHYRVEITSAQFTGLSLIARHRLVYNVLNQEMANKQIHALQMTLKAPGE